MPLFTSRKKEKEVQGFILSFLNQNCPALRSHLDGPRIEGRVNLTKVVIVVPVEAGKFLVRQAFTAVTKEFSSTGVAVVVDHPCGLDELVLGFRQRGSIYWFRAKAKHLHPMGGGFFHLGLRIMERAVVGDHSELAKLEF